MVSIIVHLSVLSFCNYCPLLPYETDGGPANFPFRAYYELSKVHGTVINKYVIKLPFTKSCKPANIYNIWPEYHTT
jgi:hypothetical protein